ncbi:MAG: thioredoxin fold domain-containing protein [Prevotella sp.]|jgi:thioredoxin|nr:thioredoxin fold domain-containing protein [Prevotella sp.]
MKRLLFALVISGSTLSAGYAQTNSGEQIQSEKKETRIIYLNKTDFLKNIINYKDNPGEFNYLGDKPALIDFYADWCGPCKVMAPVLEELADRYNDQIYIYKIDADKEPELVALFGIKSLPSFVFIPMDNQMQIVRKSFTKETLKEAIDKKLLKNKL